MLLTLMSISKFLILLSNFQNIIRISSVEFLTKIVLIKCCIWLLGQSKMNLSYKINNILSNKCTRAIGNSKNARTSPYDGTESRDTTSS